MLSAVYSLQAMESVPHRDMLSMLNRAPLSTPTSREVTKKLARSQLPEVPPINVVRGLIFTLDLFP